MSGQKTLYLEQARLWPNLFAFKLFLPNLPSNGTFVVHRLLKVEILLRNIALLYGPYNMAQIKTNTHNL